MSRPSCERWGYLAGAPDTDNPACDCPMCTVRRDDRARGQGKRKRKR